MSRKKLIDEEDFDGLTYETIPDEAPSIYYIEEQNNRNKKIRKKYSNATIEVQRGGFNHVITHLECQLVEGIVNKEVSQQCKKAIQILKKIQECEI